MELNFFMYSGFMTHFKRDKLVYFFCLLMNLCYKHNFTALGNEGDKLFCLAGFIRQQQQGGKNQQKC